MFLWGLSVRACIIALLCGKLRLHFKRGRFDGPCGVVVALYDGVVMLRRVALFV